MWSVAVFSFIVGFKALNTRFYTCLMLVLYGHLRVLIRAFRITFITKKLIRNFMSFLENLLIEEKYYPLNVILFGLQTF